MVETLLPAYEPCAQIGSCKQAIWNPRLGHVPRGFLGATGRLAEVRVVAIFAEPGHPYPSDDYSGCGTPIEFLAHSVDETYRHFRHSTDTFHSNTRWFLDQIWPHLSFDEQLHHVWLTEGRMCSIEVEIGGFSDNLCAPAYLQRQLELMPYAVVIPFGGKARKRVGRIADNAIPGIYALSPPGANHKPARPSWQLAIEAVRAIL